MKHYCPISGLSWNSPFLELSKPSTLKHPVFSLSYPELLSALESHFFAPSQSYTATEFQASEYLLLIASFAQLPVIEFKCALKPDKAFRSLLMNRDRMLKVLAYAKQYPYEQLPQYVISRTNSGLENLSDYLDAVQSSISARRETLRAQAKLQRVAAKEQVLTRLLQSYASTANQRALAKILPEWADLVCGFPTFKIKNNKGEEVQLNEAWKEIIRLSVLQEYHDILINYTIEDIEELIEDCEDSLELGTAYSTKVLRVLRKSLKVLQEFVPSTSPRYELDLSLLDTDEPRTPIISRDIGAGIGAGNKPSAKSRLQEILAKRGIKPSRN